MFCEEAFAEARRVAFAAWAEATPNGEMDYKDEAEYRFDLVHAALVHMARSHERYLYRSAAKNLIKRIPDGYSSPRAFLDYMRAHYR